MKLEEWTRNCEEQIRKKVKYSSIVEDTIDFVKTKLESNDASHDWLHIERVWRLARTIAIKEKIEDLEIIELAALLHDIDDWKYSGDEFAGLNAARCFLTEKNVPSQRIEKIVNIIKGVGFKEELTNLSKTISPELACVQDADRLDAIGAIGIARCFSFGGYKKRTLYDPKCYPRVDLSKEAYMESTNSTTINHFYEKLLKLKDLMKTETGKQLAIQRHEFMQNYLQQFFSEISGDI